MQFLKDGLAKLNVPYSYGFAIILLTLIVKFATYPLTKQQVSIALSSIIVRVDFLLSGLYCYSQL